MTDTAAVVIDLLRSHGLRCELVWAIELEPGVYAGRGYKCRPTPRPEFARVYGRKVDAEHGLHLRQLRRYDSRRVVPMVTAVCTDG